MEAKELRRILTQPHFMVRNYMETRPLLRAGREVVFERADGPRYFQSRLAPELVEPRRRRGRWSEA